MEARFGGPRDRWADGTPSASPLLRFIQSACSPENFEPNLAVSLEIADLINSKKGSAPREAAFSIVGFINNRNPTVALLALNLLDICVKNCGYPFHLQISTKEFLNELVRRFPERPPVRPTRVQSKILEAIEEWRSTICDTSRYKEDLGFIRDMHRLLSYKGYHFPQVRIEDVAVLNPRDNLRSAEEMEEEEREAQSAKLQELIRRGTPDALQEANHLMKVMAGFDTRSKTDYRAKVAEEVAKIQAKARILEERLEAFQPGDTMENGDVFAELASSLRVAQPKIQKMCEDESGDHEAVAKLLDINDSIHRTIRRYELMKKGNFQEALQITSGSKASEGSRARLNATKLHTTELSLIDFGSEPDGQGLIENRTTNHSPNLPNPLKSNPTGARSGVESDLLGLFIGDSSSLGREGGIALGFGANTNIPGPALLSTMTQNSTAASSLPQPTPPTYSAFASPPLAQLGASTSHSLQHSALVAGRTLFQSPSPAAADPFAGLGSLTASRLTSNNTPTSLTVHDDDDWSFSSALPPETPSALKEIRTTISDTSLKIECLAQRLVTAEPSIKLSFAFSNNTTDLLTDLHFQIAVIKGYELQLRQQSGRTLSPGQSRGITQEIEVRNATDRSRRVESIKLRWRAAYRVGAEQRNEAGDIDDIRIA